MEDPGYRSGSQNSGSGIGLAVRRKCLTWDSYFSSLCFRFFIFVGLWYLTYWVLVLMKWVCACKMVRTVPGPRDCFVLAFALVTVAQKSPGLIPDNFPLPLSTRGPGCGLGPWQTLLDRLRDIKDWSGQPGRGPPEGAALAEPREAPGYRLAPHGGVSELCP